MTWTTSPDVPVLVRPPKTERAVTVASSPELSRIKSALDAIPNTLNSELDYDNWFRIICAIHFASDGSADGLALAHDFSARAAKYDAEFLDSRVWPYVRSDRGGAVITDRTLFATAAEHGWSDPAIADDFDVIADAPPAAKKTGRFTPIPAHEFAGGRPPSWIVRDVIPDAELVVVFGESGSGKSFFVLDLVAAIARGVTWRGKATKQGRVIYIAAEGAGGFRKRLKAYGMANSVPLELLDVAVIPNGPNLLEKADVTDLINDMRAFGRTDIVVVDTLAQTMPGDENSGEDMGRVITHCRTIHKVTGALIILIHHAGKTANKGARGWSGLRAAADAEIEIVRADNDRAAVITKLKDGEDGAELGFKLSTIPVDMDDDGEVVSSCVVEHSDVAGVQRQKAIKGVMEKRVWQAAIGLQRLDGGQPTVGEVIDETVNQTPFDGNSGKRDTRRQHALRALNLLIEGGRLRSADGRIEVVSVE